MVIQNEDPGPESGPRSSGLAALIVVDLRHREARYTQPLGCGRASVREAWASLYAVFVFCAARERANPRDIAQGFADCSNQNHAQRAGCSRAFSGPWQGPTQLCDGA